MSDSNKPDQAKYFAYSSGTTSNGSVVENAISLVKFLHVGKESQQDKKIRFKKYLDGDAASIIPVQIAKFKF